MRTPRRDPPSTMTSKDADSNAISSEEDYNAAEPPVVVAAAAAAVAVEDRLWRRMFLWVPEADFCTGEDDPPGSNRWKIRKGVETGAVVDTRAGRSCFEKETAVVVVVVVWVFVD